MDATLVIASVTTRRTPLFITPQIFPTTRGRLITEAAGAGRARIAREVSQLKKLGVDARTGFTLPRALLRFPLCSIRLISST